MKITLQNVHKFQMLSPDLCLGYTNASRSCDIEYNFNIYTLNYLIAFLPK